MYQSKRKIQDFEFYYLFELTRQKIKPLSRWEKPLSDQMYHWLHGHGLQVEIIPRKTLSGRGVTETIFSTSRSYTDLYQKKFANTVLSNGAENQELEGFLFGYPSCCVKQFIHYPYSPNGLDPEVQSLLFHWACDTCRSTAGLIPYYQSIYQSVREWHQQEFPNIKRIRNYRKSLQKIVAVLMLSGGFLSAQTTTDSTHYIPLPNDLSGFLLQYPTEKLWKSEMTLVPFGGADNLMDILPIVCSYQRNVSLRMSSSLSLREIRNHNMIFMGEFKNLRVLEQIIRKTPIRFQYYPEERLFILDDNGDTLNTYLRIEAPYEQKDKYNVDYSLLIKSHGFTDENFIFIVGFGYGGRIERTRTLSDSKLRSQLYQDILKINKKIPNYFIVLFEVKSIERTGITNEIKYFKELSKDLFSD